MIRIRMTPTPAPKMIMGVRVSNPLVVVFDVVVEDVLVEVVVVVVVVDVGTETTEMSKV